MKKNNRFIKQAQMPPMGGPAMGPPMGATPPMGLPPPPMGMPMGGPPPMIQPMTSPPDRMEITTPLDSLGKILYDADVTEMIENQVGDATEEIARKIWEMYGGDERGQADPEKVGARSEEPLQEKGAKHEREATEDSRWLRLPEGKNIGDITSIEEIQKLMNGLAMGTVKQEAAAAGGGAPPGGAPPMMAHKCRRLLRLANALDAFGLNFDADYIDNIVIKVNISK